MKHDQFIGKWLRRCDLLGFLLAGSTVIFGYSYGVLWVGSAAVWFMVGLVGAAAKILYHRTSRRAYRTLDRIVGLGGAPILLAYQFWHQPGMGVAGILCYNATTISAVALSFTLFPTKVPRQLLPARLKVALAAKESAAQA